MSVRKWIYKNAKEMKGKTVAITGSTGGLGGEICKILASLGAALILVDRNFTRSQARKEELLKLYPDIQISLITADLEDIESVKNACSFLQNTPLDILILNAGAYSIPRKMCDTGYDNVFQINFISQYYIARKMLPVLKARGGRVIAVGSIAHNYSKTDEKDVDFHTRTRSNLVYGNSKRFLMFSLYSLCKEADVPLSVVHPGITFTNITAHYPPLIFAVIKHPMKVIFMRPRKACLSVIKGVFDSCGEMEWIGPRLFDIWGYPVKRRLKTCKAGEYDFILSTTEEIYKQIDD